MLRQRIRNVLVAPSSSSFEFANNLPRLVQVLVELDFLDYGGSLLFRRSKVGGIIT